MEIAMEIEMELGNGNGNTKKKILTLASLLYVILISGDSRTRRLSYRLAGCLFLRTTKKSLPIDILSAQ